MKPETKKIFSLELPTALPKTTAQLMSVCVMSAALAACGGSSGGTSGGEMDGGSETDPMDEVPTIVSFGSFTPTENDVDGDGLWEDEEIQLGLDPLDADSDGNNVPDGEEDYDDDGVNNYDEIIAGTNPLVNEGITDPGNTDPVDEEPDPCDDPDSSNDSWTDNCQLQRYGTYARSLYVQGVQRILWCQGFGGTSTIDAYADGILGRGTAESIREFQAASEITVDGVVGPETWRKLYETLNALPPDVEIGGTTYAQWSIDGPNCDASTVQFYQEVSGFDVLGWKMAATPGSSILVDFSSDPVN